MFRALILTSLIGLSSAACGFPNGTDNAIVWWQGATTAKVTFTQLNAIDDNGNSIYPISLTKPFNIATHLINNQNEFTKGNLIEDIKVYEYSGWASRCSWSEIPTFGQLSKLDACSNGIPCPVPVGEQDLHIAIDLSNYKSIIGLLKNDSPYKLELKLTDKLSGTYVTLVTEARAETK